MPMGFIKLKQWMPCSLLLLALSLAGSVSAETLLVQKQTLEIAPFTTINGANIEQVRVGYETYGKLNADKSNAILITHYFSGSSHAAGKYRADDAQAGYWDAIIGPGKAIDTNRFFVVSVDTLVNLAVHDPNVITTGPASIDPKTGKPYGMRFPVISVGDFVQTQKALLERFGISKLHAIVGASGGAIQALQWAATHPGFAERTIAVIGPGFKLDAHSIAELDTWLQPIVLDPNWRQGDYYAHSLPNVGLAHALRNVTVAALSSDWLDKQYGRQWHDPHQSPAQTLQHEFKISSELLKRGFDRAAVVDANHFLYTARAYQLFDVSDQVPVMKGRFLFIPAKTDRIFPPTMSHQAAETLRKNCVQAEVFEIDGGMGHLDGIFQIQLAAQAIRDFLQ